MGKYDGNAPVCGPFGTVAKLEQFKKEWDEARMLVLKGLRKESKRKRLGLRRMING